MEQTQIAERILEYLEKLGQALADLAPSVTRLAYQTVRVKMVLHTFEIIALIVLGCIFFAAGYKARRVVLKKTYRGEDDFTIHDAGILLYGGAVFWFFLVLFPLSNLVTLFVAPEYSAVKGILSLLLGCGE